MANRYEQHHHHRHHNTHNQKTIFLPMFCSLSIKDVKQSCHRPIHTPAAGEPSSPKVSCMGQVKRNNRVIGYPTAAAAGNHQKHIITNRNKNLILSRKTLLPNTTAINPVTSDGGRTGTRTSREITRVRKSRRSRVTTIDFGQDCVEVVDIADMDPPLPVVKRVAPPGSGRDEVNIWKRRFNGVGGLKSLEIERIHLPDCKFQPPPTLTVVKLLRFEKVN